MKEEVIFVKANEYIHQEISCSFVDMLLENIPVSVLFFFREQVDCNLLINSLKCVLTDFPIFSGTLKSVNNKLYIDCNNNGVSFSVSFQESTIEDILTDLPNIKNERLVDIIDPKKVISNQNPLLTIKVSYFACGGMIIGICWHHSIGDMHSFAQFMNAWSNSLNGKTYTLPLIINDRDEYLRCNLKANNNHIAGVRYLNTLDMFNLLIYMSLSARNKKSLRFYFSNKELTRMKQTYSRSTHKTISRSDALCAHMFRLVLDLDRNKNERLLSIAINYRSRVNLPHNILGNFVSSINILGNQTVSSLEIAESLRNSINNFQEFHMDFFSTRNYINENGGIKKISRFISKSIDPIKRTLFVTNWSNFGIYNIAFGEIRPFYFCYFGNTSFPWLSSITEGFSNNGLIYSVVLPSNLAKQFLSDTNLQKIHKCRDPEEKMPEIVDNLRWLL